MIELENNKVRLIGQILIDFKIDHQVYGENFYSTYIVVKRLSDNVDILPLTVSERLLNMSENYKGRTVSVSGQFRSYNQREGTKNTVKLSVFAREIKLVDDLGEGIETNTILLDGYICKKPVYRKTPFGREVADVFLAVNRQYKKCDYIPCVAWGRAARYVSNLNVGDHLRVEGRIQSREYQKRLAEAKTETRVAYEVSISKLEMVQ